MFHAQSRTQHTYMKVKSVVLEFNISTPLEIFARLAAENSACDSQVHVASRSSTCAEALEELGQMKNVSRTCLFLEQTILLAVSSLMHIL